MCPGRSHATGALEAELGMGNPADELALLDQHGDVLFRTDSDGKLAGLNEPGDDPPPRLFLARGETTHRMWFRADVGEATIDACRALARDLPPWDRQRPPPSLYAPLRGAIEQEAPIVDE